VAHKEKKHFRDILSKGITAKEEKKIGEK